MVGLAGSSSLVWWTGKLSLNWNGWGCSGGGAGASGKVCGGRTGGGGSPKPPGTLRRSAHKWELGADEIKTDSKNGSAALSM